MCLTVAGCGVYSIQNPAFPLEVGDARAYLKDRQEVPITLSRPLLVLAGYQDPGFGVASVARRIRRSVRNPELVISINFIGSSDFDACRERVIERVHAEFPSDSAGWTRDVDVIGISMGGIVARHAARDCGQRRLRINRLFTIATPHLGANMAELATWDRKQIDMRIGSQFLAELNGDPTSQDFTIIPYARLGDQIVGVENTAPEGDEPWWVPNEPLQFAHLTAPSDPRILADILQRLRGGTPFTNGEPTPVPTDSYGADS